MPYVADPTDVTQPQGGTVKASQAAPEFRALKLYVRDTILATLNTKAASHNAVFTGTAQFEGADFTVSPTVPTPEIGAGDTRVINAEFLTAYAVSLIPSLPGAVGNDGLSLTSDGVDTNYRMSAADSIAILNFLGA